MGLSEIVRIFGLGWLHDRLSIPNTDLAAVSQQTALYTSDHNPLTPEQIRAADMAIIDYVAGHVAKRVEQVAGPVVHNLEGRL